MKNWKEDTGRIYPRLYKWSSVIGGLDFSRSLFLVYFLSLGFSGAQMGLLQALLFWTSFALELPTGIYADRHGRKISALLGLACLSLTFVLLANSHSFPAVAAGFVLWGVAFAFISGAGSALLYDGLKEAGRIDEHVHWLGNVRSLGTLGMAGAIFLGGWLFGISPTLIFWASAASALIGLFLLLPIPEPLVHESVTTKRISHDLIRFFSCPKGRNLAIFLVGMGGIEMAHTPFFIFSQSLFHDQGLSEWGISALMGSAFLLSAAVQRIAPRWHGTKTLSMVLTVAISLVAGFLVLWKIPTLWVRIPVFFLISSLPNFLYVHSDQYVQDHCESQIRASLLSVHSFVSAILIGVAYLALGALRDHLGMAPALACLAIPVLAGTALVAWHFARSKNPAV